MPAIKRLLYVLTLYVTCCFSQVFALEQVNIQTIELMPDMPQPYSMRNWDIVADDLNNIIFDSDIKGEHLPLIRTGVKPGSPDKTVFFIPSYVGINRDDTEAITCLGLISSNLIANNHTAQNRIVNTKIIAEFFNEQENLYLNSFNGTSGNSFWYELFPSVLFYRLYNFEPSSQQLHSQFIKTADSWHKACLAMGASVTLWRVPDFNHTAFSIKDNRPVDNDIWLEADSAAAIGWLEYSAYSQTSKAKYLNAAKWSMEYLQNLNSNPFYEVLLPLGAYTSARMNAETGTDYNTEKLVNWCFNADNNRHWGVTTGKWGDLDCDGLVGSISDKENMYAFAMNSFDMACSLVPLVRYDERFADSIGKWMLNMANSARLFYPDSLPSIQQTDYNWSKQYDPAACIAYEGIRQKYCEIDRAKHNIKTIAGKVVLGSIAQTRGTDKNYQIIEEDESDNMTHIWSIELSDTEQHRITIAGKTAGRDHEYFTFYYSEDIDGPYKKLFDFRSETDYGASGLIDSDKLNIYLKVSDTNKTGSNIDKIYIDDIWVESWSSRSPYATGDAKSSGWAKTNLGVYGSVFVGILAGIIDKTNFDGILQLDCLATDFFHAPAYPTYLYYNPHNTEKEVIINVGDKAVDLYESINNTFITRNTTNNTTITIPPKTSNIIVICPANGELRISGNKMLINNTCVDYQYTTDSH